MNASTATATEPGTVAEPITFPNGIPGLAAAGHDFVLEALGGDDDDARAFQLLRSVGDPDIALIVTVPWLFFPGYEPDLPDDELAELGLVGTDDLTVFCPVTLNAEEDTIYLNLLGPFVVNTANRTGRQMVLADSDLPVRAPVRLGRG